MSPSEHLQAEYGPKWDNSQLQKGGNVKQNQIMH